MFKWLSVSGRDIVGAEGGPWDRWFGRCALALTGMAIVSSAFHFWPFEDKQVWRMLCLPNLGAFLWIAALSLYGLSGRGRRRISTLLPHVSILAYVAVNVMSIAFAAGPGRAVSFTIKLALMLIGGYLLFCSAMSGVRPMRTIYGLIIAAAVICVSYSLLGKYGVHGSESGFFGNSYKYGTYVGTLVPLCAAYLFMSSRDWQRLLGGVLVVEALISSSSLGCVAAIAAGMVVSAIVVPRWWVRFYIMGCLLAGIGVLVLLGSSGASLSLQEDMALAEKDGTNLRQRYIEWQAEMNLLEERSFTGTGAGCVNDYRSNFYYRLPKLNTLKAFDQNGWIATSAETGVFGLVCFCWIVVYHLRLAYAQLTTASEVAPAAAQRFATANFVGFSALFVANLFSSVHYNGVVIVFALVLALISRTCALFGRQP
ncbi:MAG: O-antigen ligase family protein [Phycisphaerales bacterium]|nr:MAG: O-antigen ligase family protein [Phycisphaerales bacterium]